MTEPPLERLAYAAGSVDIGPYSTSRLCGKTYLHDTAAEKVAVRVTRVAADLVAEQREAFLTSDNLDPAWIAGWHAAIDHTEAHLRRAADSKTPTTATTTQETS